MDVTHLTRNPVQYNKIYWTRMSKNVNWVKQKESEWRKAGQIQKCSHTDSHLSFLASNAKMQVTESIKYKDKVFAP